MAVRYWDYWTDSASTSTTTGSASQYYNTWSTTNSTSATTTMYVPYSTATTWTAPQRIEKYVVTGFDDWTDHARAVFTRLVNDETDTGFKITMWLRGDVEITDPSIMLRDLDWFMLRLRQVATAADYQKIAGHVAQVRAELASADTHPEGQDPAEGLGS